jgi:hypothetical protein
MKLSNETVAYPTHCEAVNERFVYILSGAEGGRRCPWDKACR